MNGPADKEKRKNEVRERDYQKGYLSDGKW